MVTTEQRAWFDDTSRLLGLDGLAVLGFTDGSDGPVVYLETADERGAELSRVRYQGAPEQGAADHLAAGPADRWPAAAVGVEQASLAM
jgi:hypothetical protein